MVYGQINAPPVTQTRQGLRTNQCHASDPDKTGFTGKMPSDHKQGLRANQCHASDPDKTGFTGKSMPRQ